jgi:hypothetical protein
MVGQMKQLILMTALLGTAGCAAVLIESGGFQVDEELTQRGFTKVRNRASFEMSCDKDRIDVVVLAVDTIDKTYATQLGASGCGHKRVYVSSPSGWVLDSASKQDASSTPADPAAIPTTTP